VLIYNARVGFLGLLLALISFTPVRFVRVLSH